MGRIEDLNALFIVYSLGYCVYSLRLLKRISTMIKQYYAHRAGIHTQWLVNFITGAILVILVDLSTTGGSLWFI